jgi:hypothetical protein
MRDGQTTDEVCLRLLVEDYDCNHIWHMCMPWCSSSSASGYDLWRLLSPITSRCVQACRLWGLYPKTIAGRAFGDRLGALRWGLSRGLGSWWFWIRGFTGLFAIFCWVKWSWLGRLNVTGGLGCGRKPSLWAEELCFSSMLVNWSIIALSGHRWIDLCLYHSVTSGRSILFC